jgi:hypothetical protein
MHVLLTGAGFSKDWGGRLALEFQQDLVSDPRVRARPELLRLVALESSFEVAYAKAQLPPFEDPDRDALNSAIRDVFSRMDQNHRDLDRLNAINHYGVCEFISRFCPTLNTTGFFFTLNQDVLVERLYHPPVTAPTLYMPGIEVPAGERSFGQWIDGMYTARVRFDPNNPPVYEGCFNYMKLHGSSNWIVPGGSTPMVIGTGKDAQIAGNPLLAWYFGIFERVLNAGDTRLMVIGYGFGDEHINKVIADAVRNSGLDLFVWNPHSNPLRTVADSLGSDIIPAYSTTPISEVFPRDQSRTAELRRIREVFFQERPESWRT